MGFVSGSILTVSTSRVLRSAFASLSLAALVSTASVAATRPGQAVPTTTAVGTVANTRVSPGVHAVKRPPVWLWAAGGLTIVMASLLALKGKGGASDTDPPASR